MAASRPRRTFAHIQHSRPRRAYRARSSLPRRVPSSPDRGGRRSPRARASYSTSCPRIQPTARAFASDASGRRRRPISASASRSSAPTTSRSRGAGSRRWAAPAPRKSRCWTPPFCAPRASSSNRAAEHGAMHVPWLLARRPHGGAALRQRLRQLVERRHEAPRSLRLALRLLRLAPRRLPRRLRAVAGPPPRGHVWTSGQAADVCESYRPRGRDSMLSM